MATTWTTAVEQGHSNFGRSGTPQDDLVHAWDATRSLTACGKTGAGLAPRSGSWTGLVIKRCPDCVKNAV